MDKAHVIIIGGGFTGCALAHDLALRGVQVTLVERGELTSGTSGRTHGLLHSGARYCVNDPEAAVECIEENITLRKIAKQCIEFNGGLFIALDEDDEAFASEFAAGAQYCGIPIEQLTAQQVRALEPAVTSDVRLGFTVPDGTFDPLRLALAFAASACQNGAVFHDYHQVESLILDGKGNVAGVRAWDRHNDLRKELRADLVVNATGAWAGEIATMADLTVPVVPTPGVMVAYDQRLVNHVLNRLALPGDGDILLPQRRMLVIGTTSFEASEIDYIPVIEDQVEWMHRCAVAMVPGLAHCQQRGAWMSARPLVGSLDEGRSLSRTFVCFNHKEQDGVDGFITITGGKATTCRAMAEKTADEVCKNLSITTACQTKDFPLASYREFYRS